ncbi:helix-turn-helix domain-containing protein [uncultured Methylobacterium sp.]|uniref:helix-turn-helix domain-containing protein n=1 Tax=uncultured Methylobacterium sp. TaxID=157278 RepID=UPI0035CAE05B
MILPEAEFERLRELAEDALDERIIEASQEKLQSGAEELLTEADLDTLRAAPSPLAFWRTRRGIAIDALAQDCGVPEAAVAAIERGEDIADPALYERLARALGIDTEDIVPEAA